MNEKDDKNSLDDIGDEINDFIDEELEEETDFVPENLPKIEIKKTKSFYNEIMPQSPLLPIATSIIRQSNKRSRVKDRFFEAIEADKEATKYLSNE